MRMNNKPYKFQKNPFRCALVEFHPHTIKYVKKGHPWVTEDSFTKKFPSNSFFLKGTKESSQTTFGIFLHDPKHPKIKARLWSYKSPEEWNKNIFEEELLQRLIISFEKRAPFLGEANRQNFYLIFGEADSLPGLKLQVLAPGKVLIQYYSHFWGHFQKELLSKLGHCFKRFFSHWKSLDVYIQTRGQGKQVNLEKRRLSTFEPSKERDSFLTEEFGITYQLHLNKSYDCGLYTDMASFRESLNDFFYEGQSVLNLYSYTGAFSLFALKRGAKNVHSVDLSPKYLDWLEKNLELNPDLDPSCHSSKALSVDKALKEYQDQNQTFDLIISDPPSSSSDGKVRSQAIKSYQETLPQMLDILSKQGKIVLFLNTHSITLKKFSSEIESILRRHPRSSSLKIEKLSPKSWDCLSKKGFPEGNYLKSLVIGPNTI